MQRANISFHLPAWLCVSPHFSGPNTRKTYKPWFFKKVTCPHNVNGYLKFRPLMNWLLQIHALIRPRNSISSVNLKKYKTKINDSQPCISLHCPPTRETWLFPKKLAFHKQQTKTNMCLGKWGLRSLSQHCFLISSPEESCSNHSSVMDGYPYSTALRLFSSSLGNIT